MKFVMELVVTLIYAFVTYFILYLTASIINESFEKVAIWFLVSVYCVRKGRIVVQGAIGKSRGSKSNE